MPLLPPGTQWSLPRRALTARELHWAVDDQISRSKCSVTNAIMTHFRVRGFLFAYHLAIRCYVKALHMGLPRTMSDESCLGLEETANSSSSSSAAASSSASKPFRFTGRPLALAANQRMCPLAPDEGRPRSGACSRASSRAS